MTEKERLYVKECDCPEIQKGWKPKFKDEVYSKALRRIGMVRLCYEDSGEIGIMFSSSYKGVGEFLENAHQEDYIFLPSLEQLLVILEDKDISLFHHPGENYVVTGNFGYGWVKDISYKIAAIKAVKKIRKEEKSDE